MRAKLPLMIAVVGFGLLAIGFIQAQQSPNINSQGEDSTAKPCVVVYGAVRSPARFELPRRVRLAGVIEMAGGATDRSTGIVQVIHAPAFRCGQPTVQGCIDCRPRVEAPPPMEFYKLSELNREDEKGNPFLQPGDIVMVVDLPPVYVLGCVTAPQGLSLKGHMTLTEAIATAGGETDDADGKKLTIYRTNPENSARTELLFDVKAIRKGQAEDPVLQPFDIVEVSCRHRRRG